MNITFAIETEASLPVNRLICSNPSTPSFASATLILFSTAAPKMASDAPTKLKLWGGRFTGKTDPLMHAFNQSLSYDKRMHDADIRGSIAYAKSLCLAGLLTRDEEAKIVDGLKRVGEEWKNGTVRHFLPQPLKYIDISVV